MNIPQMNDMVLSTKKSPHRVEKKKKKPVYIMLFMTTECVCVYQYIDGFCWVFFFFKSDSVILQVQNGGYSSDGAYEICVRFQMKGFLCSAWRVFPFK